MSETNFIDGLIVKAPHQNAPDFVKAKLSIKREELIAWLQQQSGEWINADVKESRAGKWYAAIDNWQPDSSFRSSGGDGSTSQAPANQRGNSAPMNADNPPPMDMSDAPPPMDDFDDDIPF